MTIADRDVSLNEGEGSDWGGMGVFGGGFPTWYVVVVGKSGRHHLGRSRQQGGFPGQ